jgi:ketosteroid isomerase-like protein
VVAAAAVGDRGWSVDRSTEEYRMSKKEALMATFQEFRDALFASDVPVLDRILAADYRGYNLRGDLEGREVVLEAYAPGAVSLEKFEVRELQVDVVGEVGIFTGKGYIAGSFGGEGWEHYLRFCDIYVDREGAWKLLLSHATPTEPDSD